MGHVWLRLKMYCSNELVKPVPVRPDSGRIIVTCVPLAHYSSGISQKGTCPRFIRTSTLHKIDGNFSLISGTKSDRIACSTTPSFTAVFGLNLHSASDATETHEYYAGIVVPGGQY